MTVWLSKHLLTNCVFFTHVSSYQGFANLYSPINALCGSQHVVLVDNCAATPVAWQTSISCFQVNCNLKIHRLAQEVARLCGFSTSVFGISFLLVYDSTPMDIIIGSRRFEQQCHLISQSHIAITSKKGILILSHINFNNKLCITVGLSVGRLSICNGNTIDFWSDLQLSLLATFSFLETFNDDFMLHIMKRSPYYGHVT
jgi:hypothetical protein